MPTIKDLTDPPQIEILRQLSKEYYEGHGSLPDAAYDSICEATRRSFPDHPFFEEVGAPAPSTSTRPI